MDAADLGEMFKACSESRRIGYNDALNSPAVTALLEAVTVAKVAKAAVIHHDGAVHYYAIEGSIIDALEAAAEAVRKERGE